VRPEALAAAQRTFLRILVAASVVGSCAVVGKQLLMPKPSTFPYGIDQGSHGFP
jgi:hypothetical protein